MAYTSKPGGVTSPHTRHPVPRTWPKALPWHKQPVGSPSGVEVEPTGCLLVLRGYAGTGTRCGSASPTSASSTGEDEAELYASRSRIFSRAETITGTSAW